ncbi:MAG: class I SAM-dependent methyltransferase [Chloroflexota bacterium]
MARRTIYLTDELYTYLLSVSLREPELLHRLRNEMADHHRGGCQISPEQGQFMSLLVKLMGARRTLEIGVFTGYSSLWVALALPDDGYLLACDVNPEWTAIARRYWREAGVEHKIDLHLAPATQTLETLLKNGQQDSFDFAFIDADKINIDTYYEYCLQLIRPGGLIAIDNVLRHGAVVDERRQDEETKAIRTLNDKIHHDSRVDFSLLPISDGLTLALKG